jgi:quercetin dioxygenase-like cupin family protein
VDPGSSTHLRMLERPIGRNEGGRPTLRSMRRIVAMVVTLTAAVLVTVVPSFAKDATLPIEARVLTPRSVFPDDVSMTLTLGEDTVQVDDPSRTVVIKFIVQPGAQFPWHTHPGPVIVNVKRGSLTLVDETCADTTYSRGTAFVDLGHGHVHTAFNPSETRETVLVATFFEGPAEPDPLLIPATPPAGCTV